MSMKSIAIAALSLAAAAAAHAERFTVNFSSLPSVPASDFVSGTLQYDTSAVPVSIGPLNGGTLATYLFPNLTMSVDLGPLGVLSGPLTMDVLDVTAIGPTGFGDAVAFYFELPGLPQQLNFNLTIFMDSVTGLNGIQVPAGNVISNQSLVLMSLVDVAAGTTVAAQPAVYSVTAVPEPGSWALMLAGGAAVAGFVQSRRRRETQAGV